MTRSTRSIMAIAVAIGLGFGLAGCDEAEKQLDKAKQDVGAFAIRNAAAIAGTEAFKTNGYPLEKKLDCTADVTAQLTATVACTGITKDGKPATLDGTADSDNIEKGTFVGKVEGQEVFSQDCLDCKK